MIKIDHDKCCFKDGKCTSSCCDGVSSGCVDACPVHAIFLKEKVEVNQARCIDCGACLAACKHGAISIL